MYPWPTVDAYKSSKDRMLYEHIQDTLALWSEDSEEGLLVGVGTQRVIQKHQESIRSVLPSPIQQISTKGQPCERHMSGAGGLQARSSTRRGARGKKAERDNVLISDGAIRGHRLLQGHKPAL